MSHKITFKLSLAFALALLLSACPESDSNNSQGLVQIAQTQIGAEHGAHDEDCHDDEHEEEEEEHEEESCEQHDDDEHDHEDEEHDHDDEAKIIEDASGHSVELHAAYVVIDQFSLQPCTTAAGLLKRGLDGIIGSALAAGGHNHGHGDDRPEVPDDQRNLNRPHVIDLTAEDEALLILGNMRVAEGRYCGLRLSIVPAADDAFGLPESLSLIGSGFYLDWEQDIDGTVSERTADSSGLSLPLTVSLDFPEPLQVGSDHHHVVVALNYGHLFEDIDLSSMGDSELPAALLEGLEHALEIHNLGTGEIE